MKQDRTHHYNRDQFHKSLLNWVVTFMNSPLKYFLCCFQESSCTAAFSDFSSAMPGSSDSAGQSNEKFTGKSGKTSQLSNDGSASNCLHHVFVADLVKSLLTHLIKIRQITRLCFPICQKLAASGIICVWTYEKVGRVIRLESESNTCILDKYGL